MITIFKSLLIFISAFAFLLLTGCGANSSEPSDKTNLINISNVSSNKKVDQTISNEAKIALAKEKNVTKVVAVNSEKLLVIGIEIPHHERFQLKEMEKKFTKKMEKKFNNKKIKVELSSDQKIIWELEELEKKVQNDSLSNKELTKQLKQLSKLMKEKT